MKNHDIKIELKNHICQTCGNLDYYDWYRCRLAKHTTDKGFLNMKPLKKCNGYIKRIGTNYPKCKDYECIFWCSECSAFKND